ncbi:IMPACT family protein [Candidatus Bipolaricaulota sp. J31]
MRTVGRVGRAKLVRERSRFLAFAYPVSSRREVEERLAGSRREYRDARHIVHAYRIAEGERVAERADDAGEPARSAGWPILELLRGRDLVNVLVVVVRYFGGVKLGVGRLRRAYRDAAVLALEDAGTVEFTPHVRLRVHFPPERSGQAFSFLSCLGVEIFSQEYAGGRLVLTVEVLRDRVGILREGIEPWGEVQAVE